EEEKAQASLPSTFIQCGAIASSQNRFIFHDSRPMFVGLPSARPSHHSTSSGIASSTLRRRTSTPGMPAAPSATRAAILAVLPLAESYSTSTLPTVVLLRIPLARDGADLAAARRRVVRIRTDTLTTTSRCAMSAAVPREVLARVKKLALLPEEVRQSRWAVSVTKLTVLKALCQDHAIADRFVTHLARRVRQKVEQKAERPGHLAAEEWARQRELIGRGVDALEGHLKQPSEEG